MYQKTVWIWKVLKKKTRNMMTNFSKLLNWTKLVNYWVRKFSNSKLQHIFNKCSLCLMLALIRLHIIKFIYTIELQFNSGELMVYSVFSFFEKSLRSREYLGVKILNSYFLNVLKLFWFCSIFTILYKLKLSMTVNNINIYIIYI